ncbi:copper resistance CopC family protein [Agreia sp. COWG]|uniref:copper resistance CopC family protein n=1 Tax=Agreia sp. COWG TaxID=2773266 RepID=UPI0019292420|nr:copper resistance CopC family protein [Agreia sp. COWG]CAD5990463.1 CopC domain-containing protein [Agreia sp. COWG]
MRPVTVRGLLGAAVALTLVASASMGAIGWVPSAQAHNYLVSSTPAAGEVLTTLPPDFVVTTNDNLLNFGGEDTGSSGALEVKGPDGLYYGDGCVAVNGPSISTGAALGPAGDYTVVWRVVSTDGHPVSNQFDFTWQPDAGQVASKGSASAPVCPSTAGSGAGQSSDAAAPAVPSTSASGDSEFLSAVAWIGGAILVVILAVGVTLFVLRRPRTSGEKRERTDS